MRTYNRLWHDKSRLASDYFCQVVGNVRLRAALRMCPERRSTTICGETWRTNGERVAELYRIGLKVNAQEEFGLVQV
jgi:hypothetical protein